AFSHQNDTKRTRTQKKSTLKQRPPLYMPRRARIDAPGDLQHIVIRGIERKTIFKDDRDLEEFIERLSSLGFGLQVTSAFWQAVNSSKQL
ncbi:MAG: hypothetical protein WBM78_13135, partial [Desulfobacterales bacterium]